MKDTDSYNVYYRKQGDADFTKVAGIDKNSYTIQNLENNTVYEVYVTGVNELGEGPASLTSTASTANVSPVKLPAYRLINTVGAAGEVTAHIASVTHEAGYMKDSPLDSGKTAWGVVDNDFTSWYGLDDWTTAPPTPTTAVCASPLTPATTSAACRCPPPRTGAPTAMCACSPAGRTAVNTSCPA